VRIQSFTSVPYPESESKLGSNLLVLKLNCLTLSLLPIESRPGPWMGYLPQRQFYESALNDHENAFRNVMKTHETKCTKTHGKSLQKRIDKVYERASI